MPRLLRSLLTLQRLPLVFAMFSLLMLSAALIGQYGFGLYPCHLCMYQRYPYAVIAAIGVLARLFVRSARLLTLACWLCVLLFAVDAGIASYHAGVEWGIFPGPSGCSSSGSTAQTLEELRAEIMNAPLVSCAQAMAYVFGLSLAAWNALAASFMTLFGIYALLRLRKAAA